MVSSAFGVTSGKTETVSSPFTSNAIVSVFTSTAGVSLGIKICFFSSIVSLTGVSGVIGVTGTSLALSPSQTTVFGASAVNLFSFDQTLPLDFTCLS